MMGLTLHTTVEPRCCGVCGERADIGFKAAFRDTPVSWFCGPCFGLKGVRDPCAGCGRSLAEEGLAAMVEAGKLCGNCYLTWLMEYRRSSRRSVAS